MLRKHKSSLVQHLNKIKLNSEKHPTHIDHICLLNEQCQAINCDIA